MRSKSQDFPGLGGLLIVDKPAGITSHDVVSRCRRLFHTRQVGHAGTLDPAATGVLVLGLGRATKLLTYLVGADKEYSATIRLGQRTTTDDAEGETIEKIGARLEEVTSEDRLERVISDLTGDIMQVPTSVSAIKIDGKRAYKRVLEGEEVQIPPRPIHVERFEIVGEPRQVGDFVDLDVEVECSSGTYIRALGRDLGAALGTGGHLIALDRTRVGVFSKTAAVTLDDLEGLDQEQRLEALLPLNQVCQDLFATWQVEPQEAQAFAHGQIPASLKNSALGKEMIGRSHQKHPPLVCLVHAEESLGLIRGSAGKLRVALVINPAGL